MTLRTSQNRIVTGRLRSLAIDETTICYELGFALIFSQISVLIRKLIREECSYKFGRILAATNATRNHKRCSMPSVRRMLLQQIVDLDHSFCSGRVDASF